MSLCRRCLDAVSAILDGEGRPADVLVVDNHLPQCAGCRAAADLARRLTGAARELSTGPAPDLLPTLLAALDEAPAGDARYRSPGADHHLRLVGVAACGCGAGCSCGCQQGDPCRCGHNAA